jgi:hypothetical protein
MNQTSEQQLTTQTQPTLQENKDGDGSSLPESAVEKYDKASLEEDLRIERREKVWNLRIVERKSVREIAEQLNVGRDVVSRDIRYIEEQRIQALKNKDLSFVTHQDAVYEALLSKWLPEAIKEEGHYVLAEDGQTPIWTDDPALRATDRVVKVLTEQAKLHGFGLGDKGASPKELGKEIGIQIMDAMTKLAQGKYRGNVIEGEVITNQLEDAKKDS